ncbi:hypothetical protein BABINDRAFT_159112 [Babjeviella inositovora NRRL Y-12698]|uniref:non-specific serine/threonine protein kinase n=1 Tax=Babjeviella inositovora NRRL Y-12698 TaxID=984486 RepID=A0A1E3QY17_9ASCO|nr:uncharacterized protein BABINDRAFT_159112 [Babjeviella inositovora NRRL Y-12698]ODQ82548.1 hypothetical protein BABINDRAFT_159112 [Babjeviella inositovora NRRL Y-12698]
MVMEYCPGGELFDLVYSRSLDLLESARLFAQICTGVAYVHAQSLSHRDLKLENILLTREHDVKLSDFGFVREYQPKALLKTICGTDVYMAPELLRDERYSGFAVDIWSLGVVLYTLVYGHAPFEDDASRQARTKILHDEPDYDDSVPEGVNSLLARLLNKDAKKRPTIQEIAADPFVNATLGLEPSLPFQSRAERHLLKKLKAAHMDTTRLVNSVTHNKCDQFAGFWFLSLEKDHKRRNKSRKTKGRGLLSGGNSRRVSALMENQSLERIMSAFSLQSRSRRASADMGRGDIKPLLRRPSFNAEALSKIEGTPRINRPPVIEPTIESIDLRRKQITFSEKREHWREAETEKKLYRKDTNESVSTEKKKKPSLFNKLSMRFWIDKVKKSEPHEESSETTAEDSLCTLNDSVEDRKVSPASSHKSRKKSDPSVATQGPLVATLLSAPVLTPTVLTPTSEFVSSDSDECTRRRSTLLNQGSPQAVQTRRPVSMASMTSQVTSFSETSDYGSSVNIEGQQSRPHFLRTQSDLSISTSLSNYANLNSVTPLKLQRASLSLISNSSNNSETSSLISSSNNNSRPHSPDTFKKFTVPSPAGHKRRNNIYNESLPRQLQQKLHLSSKHLSSKRSRKRSVEPGPAKKNLIISEEAESDLED